MSKVEHDMSKLIFQNVSLVMLNNFNCLTISKKKLCFIGEGFMGGVHPPLRSFLISDFVLQDTKKIFASVITIISGFYG